MENEVICPWCLSPTRIEEEEHVCTVCERLITDEDLELAALEEN